VPFTKEEKYANFVSVLEGQIKTFEAAVARKDFKLAGRLWDNLGIGLPIEGFKFAPPDMLQLDEIIFYYVKDAVRDPVKFGDFFASCK
jgi:hypothetical protein